jgi:ribosomal protein S17E
MSNEELNEIEVDLKKLETNLKRLEKGKELSDIFNDKSLLNFIKDVFCVEIIETISKKNEQKEYKLVINKNGSPQYDDIDWFDLENEIEKIIKDKNLDKKKYKYKFENILERRFNAIKGYEYTIEPTDLNIVFQEILNTLIENADEDIDKIGYPVSEFYKNEDIVIGTTLKHQITKTMNYLQSYEIVKRVVKDNQVRYILNLGYWSKQSNHPMPEGSLLPISSLVMSYIKNGNIKTFNIKQFFKKMSDLIEDVIKPAFEHNKKSKVEIKLDEIILDNNSKKITNKPDKTSIDIIYVSSNGKIKMSIIPIKISIKEKEEKKDEYKIVECYDLDKKENTKLVLNNISISKNSTQKSKTTKSNEFEMPTTNLSINADIETIQEQEEFTEVILECDSVIHEYFKIKPLKNMVVYDTEEKLSEFRSKYEYLAEYGILNSINKFYIVANDRESMIISTVLHTLQYVRILEPSEINDKLISMFKSYSLRNGFDICEDKTPPTPSNPIEPTLKKEDIKSTEPIQIDKRFKEANENFKDVNKNPL